MAGLIQGVVKGISAGIGLAVEKQHDRKERKNALAVQESPALTREDNPPQYESSEATHRRYDPRTAECADAPLSIDQHTTSPPLLAQQQSLPYPIVIPQRRPGTKTRGFARAYPPDLESFGIDEATFLEFLDELEAATQASPWLRAIQVSAGIAGLAPSVIAMAVSAGVQVATKVAIEVGGRYKTNAFLDRTNQEVFMPLGLFAMIIIYNPDTPGAGNSSTPVLGIEDMNMDTAKNITRRVTHSGEGMSRKKRHAFHTASGKTNGEAAMPMEVAPLVYPSSSSSPSSPDESFKERVSRNASFVQDYFDRRGQAEYINKNPDTVLAKSQSAPQFKSRFADPNHPSNSGDLISLVSGGVIALPRRQAGGGLAMLRQGLEEGRNRGRVGGMGRRDLGGRLPGLLGDRSGSVGQRELLAGGPLGMLHGGVKKMMQENILYLTVVNLPSDEELARASQMLQAGGGLRNL